MKHNVKQIVISTFEKNMDLCLSDYENVALKDLELDSLGFVSFIVDLENSLSINIPEEFLIIDELPDLLTFSQIVENLYEAKNGRDIID